MSYWSKVLEEVLNKHDPVYPLVLTNAREYINSNDLAVNKLKKASRNISVHTNAAKKHTQIVSATKKYSLGKNFPGVYLTRREAQTVFYLIHGMNTTQVAKLLDLSRRTVEFYINNMKTKLDCQFKSDLVVKVIHSDFMQLIDFSLETLAMMK